MKANEKRQVTDSPQTRTAPLKGSDYFPPGAGWNRGNRQDDSDLPSTQQQPSEPRKH